MCRIGLKPCKHKSVSLSMSFQTPQHRTNLGVTGNGVVSHIRCSNCSRLRRLGTRAAEDNVTKLRAATRILFLADYDTARRRPYYGKVATCSSEADFALPLAASRSSYIYPTASRLETAVNETRLRVMRDHPTDKMSHGFQQ